METNNSQNLNNKKRFLNSFYPNDNIIQNLSLRESSQLPTLIIANFIWLVAFLLGGIIVIAKVSIITGIFLILLSCLFYTALTLIKKGNLLTAGKLGTAGVLIISFIIVIFTEKYQTNMALYRNTCFCVIMAACNLPMCLKKTQHLVFMGLIFVIWTGSTFTIYSYLFKTDFAGALTAYIICTLGSFMANGAVYLAILFFNRLVEKAQLYCDNSEKTVQTITQVINESKEGINIGQQLLSNSEKASKSVSEITALYMFLLTETENLNSETSNLKNTSSQISSRSTEMKQSVSEQNAAITETSAAITEISANITNINGIASKRRAGMNDIVSSLDSQMELIKQIVDKVEKVDEYSKSIEAFVNTVDSIASQTGLLAMNASIEAAHAGTLGKGFSVIAQEIRKLSEETTKNATLISETLKENTQIVSATTQAVSSFAESTSKSSNEIKNTIQAIEEILAGISEMDIGTQEVMKALQNIVDESRTNTDLINDVVTEIDFQTNSVNNIADFSKSLDERVSGFDDLLRIIKIAISEIKKQAEQNQLFANKIASITDED